MGHTHKTDRQFEFCSLFQSQSSEAIPLRAMYSIGMRGSGGIIPKNIY